MSHSILIVQDDTPMRALLRTALEEQHHTVSVVAAFAEALRLVRRRNFDLVLAEFRRSTPAGLTGLGTLHRVRPGLRWWSPVARGKILPGPADRSRYRYALRSGYRIACGSGLGARPSASILEPSGRRLENLARRRRKSGPGSPSGPRTDRPAHTSVMQASVRGTQAGAALRVRGPVGDPNGFVSSHFGHDRDWAGFPRVPLCGRSGGGPGSVGKLRARG